MNLKLATLEYVALKQSMGMRFETESTILRALVKQMGDAVAVAAVTSKGVLQYLNGRKAGPVTLFWHRKHDALKGFWEFAIRRGYTDRSPVPVRRAKEPVPFVPYIYTREELKRLLDGVTSYQKKWLKLESVTLRAMLLLIYGAGLRTSEALHLTCADVDLPGATLTIRESKFYKTRRIALNVQLCGVLVEYDHNRRLDMIDPMRGHSSAIRTVLPWHASFWKTRSSGCAIMPVCIAAMLVTNRDCTIFVTPSLCIGSRRGIGQAPIYRICFRLSRLIWAT
jgi:integrase